MMLECDRCDDIRDEVGGHGDLIADKAVPTWHSQTTAVWLAFSLTGVEDGA